MYSRYPNYRFAGGVRVPENYSGNAFKAAEIKEDPPAAKAEYAAAHLGEVDATQESRAGEKLEQARAADASGAELPALKGFKAPALKFNVGKLFSGNVGFEELLIIGLILLMSQSESDDGIILLLIILLFVG